MSLRKADEFITICEVLREINDLHQEKNIHDETVRKKLITAESMAKKMAKKLKEYNKEIFAGWWENNKDYEADLDRRLNQSYLVDK